MGDPLTLGQVVAGQATGQGIGVIGNFINGGISRFFKKRALLNDPSNYLKGMEKAGLNPLTMGNQTPAQVGQSTVNSQMSNPTEAMMAGVNLAKAFSEIEQNKASASKDRADTEVSYQTAIGKRIDNIVNRFTAASRIQIQRSLSNVKISEARLSKIQADVAERYSMSNAGLENAINQVATEIVNQTGLSQAQAELLAISLANEVLSDDISYNEATGSSKGGEKGMLGLVQRAVAWGIRLSKMNEKGVTTPGQKLELQKQKPPGYNPEHDY
jgi:hypothetical protein